MNATDENKTDVSNVPVAATTPPQNLQMGRLSWMWLLTLACLGLAVALVWWSLPEDGIEVTVTFPEGHGLQAEDQVLYRGIEVGYVDEVVLNQDLTSVDVKIELKSSASNLAREGTRFWIVRPQLSFSRITGLETAVGHKYVSLSPGPSDSKPAREFEGLIEAPPEDASSPGIEIVIRGDKRYSVSAGSTVTFRGVVVGRILSVNLSQDSRYVDIRAKVFQKHIQNLTTASRFWSTSGINLDFSLSKGLKVDAESISSIAQGGVSFITIASDGEPVSPGHVFKLFAQAEEEWLVAADSVSSTKIELGGVMRIQKRWKQKGLLGKRTKSTLINGIPVLRNDGDHILLVPMSAASFPDKAIEDTRELAAATSTGTYELSCEEAGIVVTAHEPAVGVFQWPLLEGIDWLNESDFRVPDGIETVLAVRANLKDSDVMFLHYPIEKAYMREDWSLPQFDGDSELWNGSPVLSSEDGKVVGILIVDEEQARVVPFRREFLKPDNNSKVDS